MDNTPLATTPHETTPQDLSQRFFAREHRRSKGALRLVRRYSPFWVRRILRAPYLLALDGLDAVLGRRDELVPPRHLNYAYSAVGGFLEAGQEFLTYFRDLCGLEPQHRVLDVGCGIGRMAVPLTKYLTSGSYEGLDIVPSGIGWCSSHITPKYPRFRFQIADIYNKQYNPGGTRRSSEYRFPYSGADFDFVYLASVFTHMLPSDLENYIGEISRVLRAGGKCFFTFFLLNEEARRGLKSGTSALRFEYALDGCWTTDPRTPETAVAYDETVIEPLLQRHGLTLETVRHGAWSGRKDYLSYQDIVVGTKM
jgi:SAM-dependent methyltransferase